MIIKLFKITATFILLANVMDITSTRAFSAAARTQALQTNMAGSYNTTIKGSHPGIAYIKNQYLKRLAAFNNDPGTTSDNSPQTAKILAHLIDPNKIDTHYASLDDKENIVKAVAATQFIHNNTKKLNIPVLQKSDKNHEHFQVLSAIEALSQIMTTNLLNVYGKKELNEDSLDKNWSLYPALEDLGGITKAQFAKWFKETLSDHNLHVGYQSEENKQLKEKLKKQAEELKKAKESSFIPINSGGTSTSQVSYTTPEFTQSDDPDEIEAIKAAIEKVRYAKKQETKIDTHITYFLAGIANFDEDKLKENWLSLSSMLNSVTGAHCKKFLKKILDGVSNLQKERGTEAVLSRNIINFHELLALARGGEIPTAMMAIRQAETKMTREAALNEQTLILKSLFNKEFDEIQEDIKNRGDLPQSYYISFIDESQINYVTSSDEVMRKKGKELIQNISEMLIYSDMKSLCLIKYFILRTMKNNDKYSDEQYMVLVDFIREIDKKFKELRKGSIVSVFDGNSLSFPGIKSLEDGISGMDAKFAEEYRPQWMKDLIASIAEKEKEKKAKKARDAKIESDRLELAGENAVFDILSSMKNASTYNYKTKTAATPESVFSAAETAKGSNGSATATKIVKILKDKLRAEENTTIEELINLVEFEKNKIAPGIAAKQILKAMNIKMAAMNNPTITDLMKDVKSCVDRNGSDEAKELHKQLTEAAVATDASVESLLGIVQTATALEATQKAAAPSRPNMSSMLAGGRLKKSGT
ncbi:MAG: hypothetical protein V4544_02320 [Pseudomonadota bacterium]